MFLQPAERDGDRNYDGMEEAGSISWVQVLVYDIGERSARLGGGVKDILPVQPPPTAGRE